MVIIILHYFYYYFRLTVDAKPMIHNEGTIVSYADEERCVFVTCTKVAIIMSPYQHFIKPS